MSRSIRISDFTYLLPDEKIALHPLAQRDQSKLLFYRQGEIEHRIFSELPSLLPDNSLLFFNDTKVIPARLSFQKETGAEIEIFLLSPLSPSPLLQLAMEAKGSATWKCTIGNLKKWNEGLVLKKTLPSGEVHAALINREEGIVTLSWTPEEISFAEIIRQWGATPLPPYIKREAEAGDEERYQTVYSHFEGAVAAPTAGLHFTKEILLAIKQRGVIEDFLTLHVSAGTFLPVKAADALEHTMHSEQIIVTRENLLNLLHNKTVIAVGTTSLRTLESVYWYGVKLLSHPSAAFIIDQNEPYTERREELPSAQVSIQAVLDYMDREGLTSVTGHTSIYIVPGYTFRIIKGLITNFHQPGSTLILLVAAFIGDRWKKVYEEALNNNYRFLSYGDSSLLLP